MTVAELIIELRKLDQSTEVWVDTEFGLKPLEMVYEVNAGITDTVILIYGDNETKDGLIN